MSSFLAEEISEIESIYYNIESHLVTLSIPSELVGMIDAIKAEINERIRELEWIMVFCIPSYDLLKPWKWMLLLHELGHVIHYKKDDFIEKFREKV